MKRKLWYHSLAQRDFVNAAAWSRAQWGAQMTRRYLDAIEAQIQRIVENPMVGSDADLTRSGLRKIMVGRHAIFYTADAREVQIVRIMASSRITGMRRGCGEFFRLSPKLCRPISLSPDFKCSISVIRKCSLQEYGLQNHDGVSGDFQSY